MWFNPIMIWILRSPLHSFLSGSILLVNYSGRKSGKKYSLPVNYIQAGDALLVTSLRKRTWWRNLRDGAEVLLRIKGKEQLARAEVLETDPAVSAALGEYFHYAPNMARYFQVSLGSDGLPIPSDLEKAAPSRVVVRFQRSP